jgi:hypothetical protein
MNKMFLKVLSALPSDGYWMLIGICIGMLMPISQWYPEFFKFFVVVVGCVVACEAYICSAIEKKIFSRVVSKGSPISYLKANRDLLSTKSNSLLLWALIFFSSQYIFLIGFLIAQSILLISRR